MDQVAEKILQEGIGNLPEDGTLYHALGLLQARNQQMDVALGSLKKAAELEPGAARYTYVYGVALNSTGNPAEALHVLEQGFANHPGDQEIIFMIASIHRDLGQNDKALEWAQKLLEINPADQNATKFIELLGEPRK